MRYAVSALCTLHLALALGACALGPRDTAGPVAAVRAFVAALEARDASAIIALLEPTDWRAEIGPELRASLALLAALELRDAAYAVEEHRGDQATVRVTGTLAYSLADGGAGERPVRLLVETVRVGGAWYLRGLELPQPAG